MLAKIFNALVVAAMAAVAAFYQLGMMAPGDVLFIALAIVFVFTGQQLIARENMALADAATSLFTRPESYRSRTAFAAYIACVALGVFVSAQAVMFA
jgi:hypothetical protein